MRKRLTTIGTSRAVELPEEWLNRLGITDEVELKRLRAA